MVAKKKNKILPYTIGKDIKAGKIPKTVLNSLYKKAKAFDKTYDWKDLDSIFKAACKNSDLFPSIYASSDENRTPEYYINKWVKSYYNARNNLKSARQAKPKSTCTDPMPKFFVKTLMNVTEKAATDHETAHGIFMSAENVLGDLLEEYIASKTRRYGLLWCAGKVLLSTDFCNASGSFLLQVKNKSNSENSSGKGFREQNDIPEWYRLGDKKENKKFIPDFKWKDLNDLINNNLRKKNSDLPLCNMSEEDYQAFIRKVIKSNPNIVNRD